MTRPASARIAVIIPTRNRASLAMDAVRSLLDQDGALEIYVSDTSASPEALRKFCRNDPRVTYLRPDGELSAAAHWDWAIRQTMERSAATHFTVHHDRSFSKPRQWGSLASVAQRHPNSVITFNTDSIHPLPPPLRLWQAPSTGKVFMIRTARAAELIAAARVAEVVHALPMFANSVVPRSVLESIVDRFGDVCRSTSPDLSFMVRFLSLHDDYLHADRSMSVLYAAHRSNGMGFLRGGGGDFDDFVRLHGNRPWLDAAPLPGVNLGCNMVFHEYELVRRQTGDRLPPLDGNACVNHLGKSLSLVENPQTKQALRAILEQNGWRPADDEPHPPRSWRAAVREKLVLFQADLFGVMPALISGFAFRSDKQALHYALKYPRRPEPARDHLTLLDVVEIDSL